MTTIIHNTVRDHWEHEQKFPGDWHRFLGPCPSCGARTFDYGGGWACVADYCPNSSNQPVSLVTPHPEWWTDGTRVFLDGTSWCAVGPGFVNLQESPAGFGDSPGAAVEALRKETKP